MEIAAIAPYVAVASGVATAGTGIVQGIRSSQAAGLERRQYEQQIQTAQTAAVQEEVVRRRRLAQVLSANEALRGARGLDYDTGTSEALDAANRQYAEDDIETARLNRLALADRARYGALAAGMRETGGALSGAGAFASGLGSAGTAVMRYFPASSPSPASTASGFADPRYP